MLSDRSLYSLDFFSLLLCMAVGHVIVGDPFLGAAVFLFADIMKALVFRNLSSFRHSDGARYFSRVTLSLVLLAGILVSFAYPLVNNETRALYLSLFAFGLVIRNAMGAVPIGSTRKNRKAGYYLSIVFIHFFFDLSLAWVVRKYMSGPEFYFAVGLIVLSGLVNILFPEKYSRTHSFVNEYERIGSYKLFTDMNLYSTMAINTGIIMLFFHILSPEGSKVYDAFDTEQYMRLFAVLLVVGTALLLTNILIRRRRKALIAAAQAVAGILIWIAGDVMLFYDYSIDLLLPLLWGMGIALLVSAIRLFIRDFRSVGMALDEEYDGDGYSESTVVMLSYSSVSSSVIVLIVLAVRIFLIPQSSVALYDRIVMQLPALFMLFALILAIRQPLDRRNREKLMLFMDDNLKSEKVKESLKKILVKPYRKPFRMTVLTSLARPFLRLKMSGRKNLSKEDYPSVFVCNHSFITGPILAVIYLPTFFRPWVHDVMLKPETAAADMRVSLKFLMKIFGRRLGGKIIGKIAQATCWALNSYDPIPVSRGTSRNVMSTFDVSLDVLESGDNILLFPEHAPDRSEGASTDTGILRSFYTGFAHLGKMYFDRTGRELLFYPIYTSLKKRCFKIGVPVKYDSSLDSRESKAVLAAQLQERIVRLEEE